MSSQMRGPIEVSGIAVAVTIEQTSAKLVIAQPLNWMGCGIRVDEELFVKFPNPGSWDFSDLPWESLHGSELAHRKKLETVVGRSVSK